MSDQTQNHDELFEEVNRLYWESDTSVNQIGEDLGLSKGVLYGLIAPHPSGLPCPTCGAEMEFPNRTARDKGFMACPECGMEEEEEAVQAYWESEAEASGVAPEELVRRAGEVVQRAVDTGRERVHDMTPRGRIVAGTALLGVAAGLALATFFRKR